MFKYQILVFSATFEGIELSKVPFNRWDVWPQVPKIAFPIKGNLGTENNNFISVISTIKNETQFWKTCAAISALFLC